MMKATCLAVGISPLWHFDWSVLPRWTRKKYPITENMKDQISIDKEMRKAEWGLEEMEDIFPAETFKDILLEKTVRRMRDVIVPEKKCIGVIHLSEEETLIATELRDFFYKLGWDCAVGWDSTAIPPTTTFEIKVKIKT